MDINDFKPSGKWLIAYDTDCVFCESGIRFIADRDRDNTLYYTSFNSGTGLEIISQLHKEEQPDSIFLYDGEKLYFKSDAVLKILRRLTFPWNLLTFLKILPRFIRNPVYDFIAKHRYKIIPRDRECPLPSPHLRKHIIP